MNQIKFFNSTQNNKGFTLIELLVVIAIISLLSSIVFSSLTSGRLKTRDAAIKTQVNQFRNLLEQNFNDTGTYANLQPNVWFSTPAQCSSNMPAGAYRAQAVTLCTSIVNASAESTNFGIITNGARLYLGNNISVSNRYSVMAYLPGTTNIYCVGNRGFNSDTTTPANTWGQPGCFQAP